MPGFCRLVMRRKTASHAVALFGAYEILYYAVARLIGISNPGGAGNDVLANLASPVSAIVVYGVAWVLVRRRLARDAGTEEAARQAAIRRLYTNLAALVSLAAFAIGVGGVLWTIAELLEAPLIGVTASDWKDALSKYASLAVVGAAVWLSHWRPAPWAADRQSLSRKLYLWAALLASVLAVLGYGIFLLYAVLQQAFQPHPRLDDPSNLDFGHYLAAVLVAVVVGVYHWRGAAGQGGDRCRAGDCRSRHVSGAGGGRSELYGWAAVRPLGGRRDRGRRAPGAGCASAAGQLQADVRRPAWLVTSPRAREWS